MTAELEAALVREVRRMWVGYNILYFHRAMKPPRFDLGDEQTRLGSWNLGTRTLTLSRRLCREQPWGVVCEVLKHEMAHQYAHEVLGARDETAHGPAFRHVCERLRIDAASKGLPADHGDVDEGRSRVVRRIQKLLALAQSPNVHEAEAAMNAARRLMLEHNLATPADGSYRFLQIGRVSGRIAEHERLLANLLAEHFFVEVIWAPAYDVPTGKNGRVLEVCGTEGNLEMAAWVHGFLLETAERLWREHRRAQGIRGDRDRQTYLSGVMRGFGDKLAEGARQCREEGLVWVGDPGVMTYMRARYPRMRTVRFGGRTISDAWEHGHAAGREIVLHKPVTASGEARGPRLLGGG